MRIAIALQIIVGIALWTGHWMSLASVHMIVGLLYVLMLWGVAGIAISQHRSTGLAAFAFVWGLVIAAFGMAQQGILVGDLHWVVRVMHLVIGIAAMPVAERLVGGATRASFQPA
jgi:hypothetical protein